MFRRRLSYLIITSLLLLLLLPFTSLKIYAGNLSNTILRLDRSKASTATGGTVCAQTPASDNGTETKVEVIFPSGFTVNSTASNWTVTTSNLPTGGTAWPGIGTATAVSGQTVTFPSSDLSTSTYYCFNFSGTSTLTTGSTGADQYGTIATRNVGNSLIDSRDYAVDIISDDQIAVTATVPANPTDFSANMALTDPSGSTFAQDTTLTYTLTYGSSLTSATTITVEAEWSLGTISGSGTPTVDLLDYVVGSASDAYGSTSPVVDTVNRKIDWTITSFPGSTSGQTVTFKLKTNSSYTGSSLVSFDVSGRVLGPGTQTADSTVTKDYQYSAAATPTSTPTPGPTSTPTPGPAATGTPTPTPTPSFSGQTVSLAFGKVEIQGITSSTAKIFITTTKPTTLIFEYGTSIKNLGEKISFLTPSTRHIISIDGLTPETPYYFKATASDGTNTVTSDFFTFTTARISSLPEVDSQSIIITSNRAVLFDNFRPIGFFGSSFNPSDIAAVLPTGTTLEFTFSFKNSKLIRRIISFFENLKVLGLRSDEDINTLSENNVDIIEISPGVYAGRFITPTVPGVYQVKVRIYDSDGNISEQQLVKIRVIKPLTVLNAKNHKPIEAARVSLFVFNPRTRVFNAVPSNVYPVSNPSFSENDGTVKYSLPFGRYLVQVSSLGYREAKVEFKIDQYPESGYPTVYLEPQPFSPIDIIKYYIGTLSDIYHTTSDFVKNLSQSIRFFDLIGAVALFLLIITTFSAFSVRTHIKLRYFPLFLLYELENLVSKNSGKYAHGEVIDETSGFAMSKANVVLYDAAGERILDKTSTNRLGEFYLNKSGAVKYKIVVTKEGYANLVREFTSDALSKKLNLILTKQTPEPQMSASIMLFSGLENIFGFTFEFLLLNCLVFEVIFANTVGLVKTMPFIVVTVLTILLWLFYASRVLRKTFGTS